MCDAEIDNPGQRHVDGVKIVLVISGMHDS